MILHRFLAYAGVLLLGSVAARADLVTFNTFGDGDSSDLRAGYSIGGGLKEGNQFSPSVSGALSKIDVGLSYLSGSHSVNFSLFSDIGNAPGTLLESFSVNSSAMFGTCCSIETLTSADNPFLTAGDEYWLIASSGADSVNPWHYNSIGASGKRYINGVVSDDTDASFRVFVGESPISSTQPIALGIPNPIPEPSSVALLAAILLAVGVAVRFPFCGNRSASWQKRPWTS